MVNITTENYKFFQHKDCEFFPCHKTNKPEDFNCLFCYCPLRSATNAAETFSTLKMDSRIVQTACSHT